jgi:glyoxylase-like metal-dependent hydrolase (beta-lactamase superfamily II)
MVPGRLSQILLTKGFPLHVDGTWIDLGDGVLVRSHRSLRLNIGLVLGDDACLVVDTRSTQAEALDLIAAVRSVTRLPWVVLNTHAHFDHCFGNATFRPAPIWGHTGCARALVEHGETQRREAASFYRRSGLVELADGLEAVVIDPPDQLTSTSASIPLGGRSVELAYLGRGHTDHDVVAIVPDASVVFAGDLVEEGDPPAFEDSFPLDWATTLEHLARICSGPVVPGHGAVVDAEFVLRSAEEMGQAVVAACRAWDGRNPADDAWRRVPYPEHAARTALARAWAQLGSGGEDGAGY